MRFAVATAILAETLPVVLSSVSEHGFSEMITAASPQGEEVHIRDFLANKRKGAVRLNGQQQHPTGEKLKTMNRRRLINSGDASLQECNPTDQDADVGILSCGNGRYCVESDESSLGGYCATVEMSRKLQSNSTLITDLYDVCYNTDAYPGCSCEGVDIASYTGSISCTYSPACLDVPNACGENVTFCYTQTYDLTVTAAYTGTAKSCYVFDQPKDQSYCYTLVIPADGTPQFCELEIDGTKCNSCQSTSQYYQGSYTDCTTFDCSNTNIASANTYCDYNIPTLQVQNTLLYDALPCSNGCSVCGDGSAVLQPDVEFTVLNNATYSCGVIELAALAGYFEGTDLCSQLQGPILETCGCSGPVETEPPFTCNICGDGMIVTNREATLEIPNQGSVSCTQLSEPGFLTSVECPIIQPLVQEPCGCASPSTAPPATPATSAPGPEVNEVNTESGATAFTSKTAISMVGAMTIAAVTNLFFSA